MNCSMLFSVYFFCHLPALIFADSFIVISSSTPHAVSSICWKSTGFMHNATVFAVSLGFVYISLGVTSAAVMLA